MRAVVNIPIEVYMRIKDLLKKDLLILVIPLILAGIAYPFLPAHLPKLLYFFGALWAYTSKEFIFFFAVLPYAFYKAIKAKRG